MERSSSAQALVDPLLREALLERAFTEVQDRGLVPPFRIHGGLARRVLDLHDEILGRSPLERTEGGLEHFFARALEELEDPEDEGARKLAAQTRFLRASIETYRAGLVELGLLDVPSARIRLLSEDFPFERAYVLGDETLGVADLDLLSKARALSELYLVVTNGERQAQPRLVTPISGELAFVARDREEAFRDVARLLKLLEEDGRLPPLHRVGVVVPRPLPYLYLAKKVFTEAGIPYQLEDSFPLATEAYLASVDLVLELIATGARRDSALALLRSPLFAFEGVTEVEVASFDELTLRLREPGGIDRLERLKARLSRTPIQPSLPGMESKDSTARALPAIDALLEATRALAAVAEETPLTAKIASLRSFLEERASDLDLEDPRLARAKAAFDSILDRLDAAARKVSDPGRDFTYFREKLRRAIEAHTFGVATGETGVSIVDARSAPFGGFDLLVLMGLNEDEWPARAERNIFYPQRLLQDFGFPSDRELLASERRQFLGLLDLPSKHLVLFRHQLEDEVPTVPSPFLEDVRSSDIEQTSLGSRLGEIVVSRPEALRRGLAVSERSIEPRPAGWVEGPLLVSEPISATAFELFLRCPFKYYSRYLLSLEEEEVVGEELSPLDRGRILHEVLQEGFAGWDRGGSSPRPIDPENYDEALALFRRVALTRVPLEHRSIEMASLLGGPGEPGAIPWILRRELAQGALQERLVEYAFSSALRIEEGPSGERPWYLRIQGRIDRADVDARGHLHVYDYKSGRAPSEKVALQVPLYAMCLSAERGLSVKESAYLSFRDRKAVSRSDFDKAQALLVDAYRRIREGSFRPSPYQDHLCESCGFALVCRKEIGLP
jgi:CRISPR/Cas system-associated exonuclease Cas4 (RecB family)